MSAPKRQVLHQWGYRINETGVEWWGYFDQQYNGANSTRRRDVILKAKDDIARAAAVGVIVTATLIRRDHLTTVWERWVPGIESVEAIR